MSKAPIETKKSVEQQARKILMGTRLFPVARDAYQSVFDRTKLAQRKAMLALYGQFVPNGSLVFDVGANKGTYVEMFQELGARIVAMEPNPALHERLNILAQRGNLVLEKCAVGDRPGTATLNVCSDPGMSTLSDRWLKTAQTSEIHSGVTWNATVEVPVTTLNDLAQKHGIPHFVKIDVEGFEKETLLGMSFAPQGLSFEFHVDLMDIATTCLRHPVFAAGYTFNYISGLDPEFKLSKWLQTIDMIDLLNQLHSQEEYGDIFCKKS
jgi:FkbM family methyltransferase